MKRFAALTALAFTTGCQLFVSDVIHRGAGESCAVDSDCQGSACVNSLCTVGCSDTAPCPNGLTCSSGACSQPFKAGFLWAGDPTTEDWTHTHDAAIAELVQSSGLSTKIFTNVGVVNVSEDVDEAITWGAQAIFTNSSDLSAAVLNKADPIMTTPPTLFFTYDNTQIATLDEFYAAYAYKGWWLMGKAAAHKAPTQTRLGMVASVVTPEVVRNVNAFALGAQAVAPNIVVEVVWLNARNGPKNPPNEESLAGDLIATNCEVIGHQANNGRVVAAIEQSASSVYSIAYHLADACPMGSTHCIGSIYWNWTPFYQAMLASTRSNPAPSYALFWAGLHADPNNSVVNVSFTDPSIATDLYDDLNAVEGEADTDPGGIFMGPYCFNDGNCIAKGMGLAAEPGENASTLTIYNMCEFVKGVVEKSTPGEVSSMDQPAIVPKQGDCAPQSQ